MGQATEDFAAKLKKEGMWTDFKNRRSELEGEGRTKKESWNMAAEEFGFGGHSPVTDDVLPMDQPRPIPSPVTGKKYAPKKTFKGKESSLREDYQWVYANTSVEDVSPDDAPSSGAWGLLQFARSDPKSFYVEWMRMVARQEDRNEVLEGFAEDATRATSEIAEMLRSLRESSVQGGSEEPNGKPVVQKRASRKVSKGQESTT